MHPGAAWVVAGVEDPEVEAGPPQVVGDREAGLAATDHGDGVVGRAHPVRFCRASVSEASSPAASARAPAALRSE